MRRLICKLLGHRWQVAMWKNDPCYYCRVCKAIQLRTNGIVPTDRVTPKPPPRKWPPPTERPQTKDAGKYLLDAYDEANSRDMLLKDVLREREELPPKPETPPLHMRKNV